MTVMVGVKQHNSCDGDLGSVGGCGVDGVASVLAGKGHGSCAKRIGWNGEGGAAGTGESLGSGVGGRCGGRERYGTGGCDAAGGGAGNRYGDAEAVVGVDGGLAGLHTDGGRACTGDGGPGVDDVVDVERSEAGGQIVACARAVTGEDADVVAGMRG